MIQYVTTGHSNIKIKKKFTYHNQKINIINENKKKTFAGPRIYDNSW